MDDARPLFSRRLPAAAAALVLMALLPGGAGAASPVAAGLGDAERAAALRAMTPRERSLLSEPFTSDRYVVVGHARAVQSFDRVTGRPAGPARILALGQAAPLAASGITSLSLTISLTYDRSVPCCQWNIYDTFDWSDSPPVNGRGKDQIASAWANGAALRSAAAWGFYTDRGSISFNLQDVVPNAGFGFEFSECRLLCGDGYADWGFQAATIWQAKREFRATNLVFKYFHTYAAQEYSLTIGGIGPSISILPTSNQVSTAVFLSFLN